MIERFKPIVDAQAAVAKLKSRLDGAEGLDRAKLLDKLIEAQMKLVPLMPSQAAIRDIEKWSREIVSLDAENKAGLKTKYEFRTKVMDAGADSRQGVRHGAGHPGRGGCAAGVEKRSEGHDRTAPQAVAERKRRVGEHGEVGQVSA